MNICLINPTQQIQPGLRDLLQPLASRGHKVIVLTPKTPREHALEYLSSIHVMVYRSIFLPRIRYTIPFFLNQARILRSVVKKEKVNVICIYKYFYPVAWVPLLYAKIFNIPTVLITDSFPGISWRYGSRFVDFVAKVYSRTIGKVILQRCDRVILLSPVLTQSAQDIGIKEHKLSVIPKGVDLAKFGPNTNAGDIAECRKDLGIQEDEAMLLNVGRLASVKGIDTLIRVTGNLLRDGFKVKTVVVGDGPATYRRKYEEMAKSIQDNIVFTGFRTDIPRLMSACDVFVLTSLSEGLPSALLEAGACGRPSVAANTGGIPDVVIHGETGFLAGPKDVDSYTSCIELLLTDRELLGELGRNAHEHVNANFDLNEVARRNEEIYEQVIVAKRS